MTIYQKRCLDSYHTSRSLLDPSIFEFIRKKEDYICQYPQSNPSLKDKLQGIRRYKSKIRILYALTGEYECSLFDMDAHPAVYFLFVALRNDDTYKDAYKLLKKQGVFD